MVRIGILWLLLGLGLAAQDWQTLFDGKSMNGWIVTPFGGAGEVEVADGSLVLNQGMITGANYTNSIPNLNYEVSWEARRMTGSDFFSALTFPVGDSFATLIVGGWGGSVVGISSIDGNDAAHNETTQHRRFEAGRWYKLRLKVTADNLSAWVDEEQLINADIRNKKISLRPGDIELSKPFGFSSYSTTAELRNIRLRKLVSATQPPSKPASTNAAAIPPELRSKLERLAESAASSTVGVERLAELCDRFGPRLAGTSNFNAAADWLMEGLQRDGFSNVRGEPVLVPLWIRGHEACSLVSPRPDPLPVLGLGGTVPTPAGGLTAQVLVVTNFSELSNRVAEARGRIVLFNAPFTSYGESVRFRQTGATEAAKAGAVATLIRSVTPFSLRTPHTGMMTYAEGVPKIPHAALAPEDAERLARYQAAGQTTVVHLELSAQVEPNTPSRNIVGELPGSEHPEQVVLMGGHFDSWDVGQGAQDDGGGCIAVWEALRLIHELGLKPRRTIRAVFWTNEEFGLAGANAYQKSHQPELANHVVAMEADNGTFPPGGFAFTGSEAAGGIIRGILGLLGEKLDAGTFLLGGGDADLRPLIQQGVPALGLRTKPNNYFWFHHSDADTVDKVAPADLQRCTAALAIMALAVADWDFPLPR